MCNRRKPITHITGNMPYSFSDIPLLVDGTKYLADGRIWVEYTCSRDEEGWYVDWEFENFDQLNVYDMSGNIVSVPPEIVYDQITGILSDKTSQKITDEAYDHALDSF